MIDPKELRIGNWVAPMAGEPFQVAYLQRIAAKDESKVWVGVADVAEGVSLHMPEHLNPIALTKETLGKCGFVQYEDALEDDPYYIVDNPIDFNIQLDDGFYHFKGSEWTHGRPIMSIHHLQNFYYAHTGKELEVNL